MEYILGLDLGTSSVRCQLIDRAANTVGVTAHEYPIEIPVAGYAEQQADHWWQATCTAIKQLLEITQVDAKHIMALGLSGQMHGTVMLDQNGKVLAPAIIWSDSRSETECRTFEDRIGKERLYKLTGLPTATGFMGPSLLWVKRNRPELFSQIWRVCLPKDYLRLKLTGILGSEYSDASGTLLLDITKREWSQEILSQMGIPSSIMPPLTESTEVVGTVTPQAAQESGLYPGIPVIAGGSDQAMSAIGSGLIQQGTASAAIGTGGQLITCVDTPALDERGRLHLLCHALPETWILMGAMLSAGHCLRWFRDKVSPQDDYAHFSKLAEHVLPGAEGLVFLPYLSGERTPHMDPKARAVFFGLSLKHGKEHMLRAIMEGVAFGLRESLEVFLELGVDFDSLLLSGGGARSQVWRQIQADVFQMPVRHLASEEHSSLGAALAAGYGVGVWDNLAEITKQTTKIKGETLPNPLRRELYDQLYQVYQQLYPRVKDLYPLLQQVNIRET